MPALSFQPRFVPFILRGDKTHTIRDFRKRPFKAGDRLYLYTGLRTKKAEKLFEAECVKVETIAIIGREIAQNDMFPHLYDVWLDTFKPMRVEVSIDGQQLDKTEKEALARRDGFSNFHEMLKFWITPKNRLPFHGQIIHWRKA